MGELRLHLIIPALDEEECLPRVLHDLQTLGPPLRTLIVVDNGSTDRTAEVAARGGATVLHEPHRGYGAACLRGLEYLQHSIGAAADARDIVVFLDADYSDYVQDLPALLTPIARGEADFVVGTRLAVAESRAAVPPIARYGNSFAVWVLRMVYGFRFTDMGPFRVIRWPALRHLQMGDRTWGWTIEMQCKALSCRLRCCEVPVQYRRRASGRSKISESIPGAVRAGTKILWVLFTHLLFTRKPKRYAAPTTDAPSARQVCGSI